MLREWVARHRHGSAPTDDLRALVEEAGDESLSELFENWLCQTVLPRHTPGDRTE